MNRRAITILAPQIGCAMLSCLLLVTSPMSGGQPGQPLRAQMPLLPPLGHDDDDHHGGGGGPEPLLQGEVPLADQQSGRSLRGYSRNVSLVGHNSILNRGLNGNLGWVDDCAYVSAYYGGTHPFAGLAVVSVTDPANPRLVEIFPGTPGTRAGQVHGSQTSRMMAVMPWSDFTVFSDPPGPNLLHLYQVPPGDCGHPVLVGTYDFGPIIPHEFQIWHDKIYVTNFGGSPGPSLMVIDAKDMAHPTLLTTWDLRYDPGMPKSVAHDLSILGGDDALAGDGLHVVPQVSCRPTGMLFGLQSSLHPFITHPAYRALADLPLAERVDGLRRPDVRATLLSETPADENALALPAGEFVHVTVQQIVELQLSRHVADDLFIPSRFNSKCRPIRGAP